MHGWIGKLLRVNLSTGKVSTEPLDPDARQGLHRRARSRHQVSLSTRSIRRSIRCRRKTS